MWNIKSASKLTQQRQQNRDYVLHREKIKSMKSAIKIKPPAQPVFLINAEKTKLNRFERQVEIDRQNTILLNKFKKIEDDKQVKDILEPEVLWLNSLNQAYNSKEYERVNRENQVMCTRLMNTKTHYSYESLAKRSQQHSRTLRNITKNARNVESARMLSSRPASAYNRPVSAYNSRVSKTARTRASSAPHNRYLTTARRWPETARDGEPSPFDGNQQRII